MRTLVKYPLEIAVSTILVALVTVTFSQVVFRYLLQAPLAWSEELARFLLMWMASLSAAYAFKTRSHFALKFVVDRFNPSMQRAIGTSVTLLVVGFLAVFAWQSLKFTVEVRNMSAPATQMSMAVPYSSALVGSVLMLYYVIGNWWQDMRAGKVE
jgi:TRAP-type C4-dicarboxylate transport system permease small subunit